MWISAQSPFMVLKGSGIAFKMLNGRDLSQLTAEVLSRDPMRHIKSPSKSLRGGGRTPPPPAPPSLQPSLLLWSHYWRDVLAGAHVCWLAGMDGGGPRTRLGLEHACSPLSCQVTPWLVEEHPTGCPQTSMEKWWPPGHKSEPPRLHHDLGTYSVFVTVECAAVYSQSRPAQFL